MMNMYLTRRCGKGGDTIFLVRSAIKFWCIFGKVLVTVGVIDCFLRIRRCQRLASGLTISVIVRAGGDSKVAHFMNDRTLIYVAMSMSGQCWVNINTEKYVSYLLTMWESVPFIGAPQNTLHK